MALSIRIKRAPSQLSLASSDASSISMAESEKTITLSEAHEFARETGKTIDDSFYFQDAFFEVEDTIFKVHRHEFEGSSSFFKDKFASAKADAPDGLTLDNPIRLEGVSATEFRQLLRVMYRIRPSMKSWDADSQLNSLDKLTTQQWLSVLQLSTTWNMDQYRRSAILWLSSLHAGVPPEQKVYLALKFRVKAWLVPSLNELAQRDKPLGLIEHRFLGTQIILKLCEVRERFQQSANCTWSENRKVWRPKNPSDKAKLQRQEYDFTQDIEEVFAKEIARFPGQ